MPSVALRAAAAALLLAPSVIVAQGQQPPPAGRPAAAPGASSPPPMTPIKVDGRQVRPGTWSYAITATGNGKTETSSRSLTISPATVNGAAAWLVVDSRTNARVSDSLYLTRTSLVPLRHLMWVGALNLVVNYTRDSVVGTVTAPQASARIATKNVNGSMATGTMLELYLRLMPLKSGWKGNAAMSAVSPQGNMLIPVTIAVAGEETITVPAGTFPCYVVVINGQGTEQRAWVSKETRDIVKVSARFTQPAGASGASMETVLVAKKS